VAQTASSKQRENNSRVRHHFCKTRHLSAYTSSVHQAAVEKSPTKTQALAFRFKAACFRTRRALTDLQNRPNKLHGAPIDSSLPVIAESRSLLFTSKQEAEFALQAGKVHNLRAAANYLNGLIIPAGATFSFWRQVPRPTRRRGFVAGRELREGCIIPNIGGGLCQLSNALYDAALRANFEIVERHGHSRIIPGSMAAHGRDATIFWNYVDLRFKAKATSQLEILLGRGELIIRLRSKDSPPAQSTSEEPHALIPAGDPVESCETCGITSCFRHPETLHLGTHSITAWLVDAYWPEHNAYLTGHRGETDWLFTPLATDRYPWTRQGFGKVYQAKLLVAIRSFTSRRLATHGAERQRALLTFDQRLANTYARAIPAAATHFVVSQNLLPFLWRDGILGGRTFDVLMTRLPLSNLQNTLDQAANQWPESPTLADFRADPQLLADEQAALAEARHWISPHSVIAKLGGTRTIKLDWILPNPNNTKTRGQQILFPASTLGRKGAYELRQLDLPLTLSGSILESPDFWKNHQVTSQPHFTLDQIGTIVLPAWVENQPRRLLQAVANQIPVIASEACGLEGVKGVTTIKLGDPNALKNAILNT
jgi:hypothetical protein